MSAAAATAQGCLIDTLTPAGGSFPAHLFGFETVVDDDRLLVGARSESTATNPPNQRGVVYSFEPDPVTGLWSQRQRLAPSFSRYQMLFGHTIDIDGDVMAISATGQPTNTFNGAVFIFEYNRATRLWSEVQAIEIADPNFFGTALQLEGDMLVVADRWSSSSTSAGTAYIFERVGGTGPFALTAQIPAPEQVSFPDVILRDGPDRLILSASSATVAGLAGAGTVLTYERAPASQTWSLVDALISPDPDQFGAFGATMALDGDQLVVAETRDGELAFFGGATFVFERDTATPGWTLKQKIQRANVAFADQLGHVRALRDGELFLSDRIQRDNGWRSLVRRYQRDDVTRLWHHVGTFESLVPGQQTLSSVSVDGDRFVIGSIESFGQIDPPGRVYLHSLSDCNTVGVNYCQPPAQNSVGTTGQLTARGNVDVSVDLLLLRAIDLPGGVPVLLLASPTSAQTPVMGSQGLLCLGLPIGRYVDRVLSASPLGSVTFELDLTAIPTPTGPAVVLPGSRWHFQAWYRDQVPGSTSDFASAVRVTFD